MVGVSLQIGRARVEVQVQGLTTNIDGRQEQSGVFLGVSRNSTGGVAASSSSSGRGHVLALLGEGNESLLDHKVFLDLEVVLPEHLPHGSSAIGSGRMSPVDLPRNFEGTFLETPLACRGGNG
jgi:hypothetical protein